MNPTSSSGKPRVSVVMPAYRAARYIAETLASLEEQSCTEWELLVFEDGEHDATASIVEGFAARVPQKVQLVRSASSIGVSKARNRLMDRATGDCVAFLDSDDTWHPDHLRHSLELLATGEGEWVIGGLNLIDSDSRLIRADVIAPPMPVGEIPTALLRHNFILTSSMVLDRRVFEGGLRFDAGLKIGEDLDLCIRLIEAGFRPIFSSRATLNYRKHGSSTTADSVRFNDEFARVFEKHLINPVVDSGYCLSALKGYLTNVIRMTWRRNPRLALAAAGRLGRSFIRSRTAADAAISPPCPNPIP